VRQTGFKASPLSDRWAMKHCPELAEGSPSHETAPDEIGLLSGLPGLKPH
jgi:hypothetical protein